MPNEHETPQGVIDEGMAPKRPRGRPPRKPPINSILRIVKGLEEMALEGKGIDPGLTRKYLADYAAICLERGFMADEADVSIKQKVDWALRLAPVVAMYEALIPKDKGAAFPKTEAAVDQEIDKHYANLSKIVGKNQTPDTEAVMAAFAPAAAEPPKEA